MLQVDHLTLKFGGLIANNDVSMQVQEGKITGLIGPNGAGKTTFFNSISGVYKPTSGTITFLGKRIDGLQPYQINQMGMSRTYQVINLFKKMSVVENVMVGMHPHMKQGYFASAFKTAGERREEREPAAGMNSKEKEELNELLYRIIDRGVSILIIEHDMKLMMGVADYLYVLNYGKLLAEGTTSEIQTNPEVIKAYLGGDE